MSDQANLLYLLRAALGTSQEEYEREELAAWERPDLLKLACAHGVTPLAWEGLRKTGIEKDLSVDARISWWHVVEKEQQKNADMSLIAADFAKILSEKGISCVVLKGLDYARFWPNPLWRSFGDLDCWLCGRYAEGNEAIAAAGAEVHEGGYKHNHIYFQGLTIENHQFLTPFAGNRWGRHDERLLQSFLSSPFPPICNTHLLSPSPEFTLLFCLYHARMHFMAEGISLRHLLDWYFFLSKEKSRLDWSVILKSLDKLRLHAFAELFTDACVHLFNMQMPHDSLPVCLEETKLRLFEKYLWQPDSRDRQWPLGVSRRVARRFRREWEFRSFLNKPYWAEVWQTFTQNSYFTICPKPKL